MTTAFTALRDEAGVSVKRACAVTGIARATYYRHARGPAPVVLGPRLPRRPPPSALSDEERAQVLAVLADPAYADLAIPQVWARELDADRYWRSLSTMYRIARAAGQVRERRRLATHPPRVRPELIADGPDQVWSWDITALKGPSKGCWYKCYVIMDMADIKQNRIARKLRQIRPGASIMALTCADAGRESTAGQWEGLSVLFNVGHIYSRYVTGWLVVPNEEGDIAKDFIEDAVRRNGARPHTIHSDRRGPMISKPVSNLLVDLGVTRSHSRPRTSNDNPYSEALFKTVKYVPDFPARFGSIEDARAFCNAFFAAYNHEHRHSGIGLHTPASVHFGTAEHVQAQRQATLDQAHAAHPERFTRRPQAPQLPKQVWINEPQPLEAQPVPV